MQLPLRDSNRRATDGGVSHSVAEVSAYSSCVATAAADAALCTRVLLNARGADVEFAAYPILAVTGAGFVCRSEVLDGTVAVDLPRANTAPDVGQRWPVVPSLTKLGA